VAGNYIGPPGTVGDGRGRQKTAENMGKQRKTTGDGGARWGTTQCHPSWFLALTCLASSGKDGTGRRNVVRPRPGPGRTDCPVADTELEKDCELWLKGTKGTMPVMILCKMFYPNVKNIRKT